MNMKCPSCQHEFKPGKIGSTVYWVCGKCYALWFDSKENDFLTIAESEFLAGKYPSRKLRFEAKKGICPRDKHELQLDDFHYHCYICGGILTTAAQIVAEKLEKAEKYSTLSSQSNKSRFKFSDFKNVVVMGSVAIFVFLNVVIFKNLSNRITIQSQASEVKTNIRIQKVGDNRIAFFFTTDRPLMSELEFQNDQTTWKLAISAQPSLTHFVLADIPPRDTSFVVKLTSKDNEVITTEKRPVAY